MAYLINNYSGDTRSKLVNKKERKNA